MATVMMPAWATKAAQEAMQADVTQIKAKVDDAALKTQAANISAQIDSINLMMAQNRVARVTVRVNYGGSGDVPSDATQLAELLAGAKIVLNEQGISHPFEATVDSLSGTFSHTFILYVSDAAETKNSSVGLVLGHSATCAYASEMHYFTLKNGDNFTVDLTTHIVSGAGVTRELCRIQPYTSNPTSNQLGASDPLRLGNSYIGMRVTTASGSTLHYGHFDNAGQWVDTSLTKVAIYDFPDSVKTERVISQGGADGEVLDIADILDCIGQAKIVDVKYSNDGGTTFIKSGNNDIIEKYVRYPQLWVKTEFTTLDMPEADSNGNWTPGENVVPVIIKWYANTQVDASYHLHPLFCRYVRAADRLNGEWSFETTELPYGYISRYPLGMSLNTTVGTATQTVSFATSGVGREWAPGNKNIALSQMRIRNGLTAVILAADENEENVVVAANSDERATSVASMSEISFIQWLAYLFFGVNVQGAANIADTGQNIFPGICTSAVSATTNGATDDLVAAGIMSGAVDTRSCTNSIVFLGVEDGIWSSTGWDDMGATFVCRRTYVTDATGTITTNGAITRSWLVAIDRTDYNPGSADPNTELTDTDSASFEGTLLAGGYRVLDFPALHGGWVSAYRMGIDDLVAVQDGYYPTSDVSQYNLNVGACDVPYIAGDPNEFGNFSASTAYQIGSYVKYDDGSGTKLWKCVVQHTGAWNSEDFEIVASKTLTLRKYYSVRLGDYLYRTTRLGLWCICAGGALTNSEGVRARPSLQVVPAT